MEKVKKNVHHAWLISLAIIIFSPISCLAENITAAMQAQLTIEKIDIAAEKIAREKSVVSRALRELKMLAKGADEWFGRLDKVNAQIRDAQKNKGEYTSFNRSQLDDALQQLKNERAEILNLNGGAMIVGQHYASMEQLKSAYAKLNQEETQRDQEYNGLKNELARLDKKRDAVSSQLDEHERKDLVWNKIKINGLQEDIKDLQDLVNDKKLWCIASLELNGRPVTQRQAMHLIKNAYLAELVTTPGKKFNSQELAQRIIFLKNASNQIKENMRTQFIPKMLKEIEELRRKVKAEEVRNAKENSSRDISGNWIIFMDGYENPMVNITKNSSGDYMYDARITKRGDLKHLGLNHKLFSVNPKSPTVFEGIEFSTDPGGRETRIGLRLMLNKQGDRMDYRSDAILTMGRSR